MTTRSRYQTNHNPEDQSGFNSGDPKPDGGCCSCLKSKSSDRSKKQNGKSDVPKPQEITTQGQGNIQKENSNGSNTNARSGKMQPGGSPEVSRDRQGVSKTSKFMETDPIDTAKNGAVNESKGKQAWTPVQENSDGIPSNMKPSPQKQKISSPGQDNKQEEIKKNGKYTGPNSTNVTKSKDETQRSDVPNDEGNNASLGATRFDPTEKTISSTVEQAAPRKEKENDHIKNRHEDILQDQHKGVHKPEYNCGIQRDTGPDLTKKETENDRIKNIYEDKLEDQHKVVHKPEYNHGIHSDTRPDLNKRESSSPDSEHAGVQKGRGKQGIDTNHEYTNPPNPSTTITGREEKRKDSPMH
ncbi:hypothetical protein Dsin_016515 [Dipteronia sinensis]|uniref:Uncharacterized protein n=1 Tax=Dipteronia sinensis TaxID=43782 RepID=A0AAE0ADD3_9ROSI|nr:hypothetical protein Dsin_016515 [Dipteronia sinensis]